MASTRSVIPMKINSQPKILQALLKMVNTCKYVALKLSVPTL